MRPGGENNFGTRDSYAGGEGAARRAGASQERYFVDPI